MEYIFKIPQGKNFSLNKKIEIGSLITNLRKIVAFLEKNNHHQEFLYYEDWLQHDGLMFFKGEIINRELKELINSYNILIEEMPEDDEVRIGIATPDWKWYLRFYIEMDEDSKIYQGNFDVTLPNYIVDKFKTEILSELTVNLNELDSEKYFLGIIAQ